MDNQEQESLLHYKINPGSGFVIGLLVLALTGLAERVLYDLSRSFAPGSLDYFGNLQVIMVHAMLIIPLLIVSVIVNSALGVQKTKYAIVLIPYFVLSIVMALQLALQVAVYFSYHHTQFQFYVVMILLVAICTAAIYYIQSNYNPKRLQ